MRPLLKRLPIVKKFLHRRILLFLNMNRKMLIASFDIHFGHFIETVVMLKNTFLFVLILFVGRTRSITLRIQSPLQLGFLASVFIRYLLQFCL
jgi:hypothetical protein